jgi:hypothetical protein
MAPRFFRFQPLKQRDGERIVLCVVRMRRYGGPVAARFLQLEDAGDAGDRSELHNWG